MDNQDQIKNHSSGHESHGFHVCHKCGWPYPNAHPSARLRRAHKRICGTIEGYKPVGSEETTHATISDDEHLSDEDHKTPSPKFVDRGNIEKSISGIGTMSNRSEDEVFADAVAEFPDGRLTPGVECLEVNREPATNVEKIADNDPDANKDTDIIQPPRNSTERSQMKNPEVSESSANLFGSILEAQDLLSSSIQKSAAIPRDDRNSSVTSVCDPIKSGTPTESSQQSKKIDAGDAMTDGGLEADSKGNKDIKLDINLSDLVASEVVSKSEKTQDITLNAVKANENFQLGEEYSDGLASKMCISDLSSEVESVEYVNASVNTAEIKTDAAQGIESASSVISTGDYNGKEEGNKNIYSLSVPDDIPVVDHAEVMLEGYKDHKGVKFISDIPSEVESVEHVNTSVDTAETKTNTAQGIDSANSVVSIGDYNGKEEGNENMLLLSVPDDIPVVDHAEVMLDGYKDHKGVKFLSDISSEVESVEHVNTSVDTAETKTNTAQGIDSANSVVSIGDYNGKEERNENVLLLSVPDDIPVVDHAEVMLEGYKDHKGVKFLSDVSSEVESVEHVNTSVDTAETKTNTAQGIDSANSVVSIGDYNGNEEGNENMLLLSVPDDIPVVDHAEVMLEGYKDHKGVKLHQSLSLDSCETIKDKEGETKDPVYVENFTSFQPGHLIEGTKVSSPDMHEGGDDKLVVKEVPAKGETDVPEIKLTINQGSDESAGPTNAGTIEIEKGQAIHLPEEQKPHDVCDNSLQMGFSESTTKVLSIENAMVHMGAAVNQITNLAGIDDSGSDEKAGVEIRDIAGRGNNKTFKEGSSAESKVTSFESSSRLSESQVNLTSNMHEGDDDGDYEKGTTEKCDEAGIESREGPVEKNLSDKIKTTPETATSPSESKVVTVDANDVFNRELPETATSPPESKVVTVDANDVFNRELPETECAELDRVSDILDIKEHGINGNDKSQGECANVVNMATESYHDGDVELLQKASEDRVMKEPLLSPLDAEPSITSSAVTEDNNSREFGGDASGIHSQSMQGEDDSSFVKYQHGASPIDVSVDSISQTDSLEGNWGSVSVLSMQSDTPAAVDTEAEKGNLKKPRGLFEGQHCERSDKAVASEIQTVPSVAHVVNESQGRKKNAEVIAKVTNWSTGKQHTPLKNLLGEANIEARLKSQNPKENVTPLIQNDETAAKENSSLALKVSSILGPEASIAEPAKGEAGKEWNSPARYPADIKREKRKVKGRPYWAQFVCCSSVN